MSSETNLAEPRPGYQPVIDIRLLRGVVLFLLAVKLCFMLWAPPNLDEAYYWLWSQHPQWSYLDHAPLVGWAEWASYHVFGRNLVGLRFPALLTLAGTGWMLWVWARRLAPAHTEHYFWLAAAIYLTSPLFSALSTLIYPDHLLVFFGIVALHFLTLFLGNWRNDERRYRHLYLGALFLGVAGLAKYNAAFIGVGFGAVLLSDRRYWGLVRTPHLYLAALLAVAVLTPVLWWNLANDFPTLKLHAEERFRSDDAHFDIGGALRLLGVTAIYLSPLLVWGLGRFLLARRPDARVLDLQAVGRWVFIVSTGSTCVLAAWSAAGGQVKPHWNLFSLLPFLLAAPLFVRARLLIWAHLAFGGLILVLATAYYLSAPLLTDALGIKDGEAAYSWGQDQLAEAVKAARDTAGADFYAAASYGTAAKFAWGLGTDRAVLTIAELVNEFDYWNPKADYAGKDAIVVLETGRQDDDLSGFFQSYEPLGDVTTTRFGRPLATYSLFLGRGYKPSPTQP